jgi:hypothetical protein
MTNITLSVPEALYSRMQKYNEIKWSVVVRGTIEDKLNDLERMDRTAARIKLTQEDADEIAKLIKAEIAREL